MVSRRNFIRTTGLLGLSLPFFDMRVFSNEIKDAIFLSKIGVCTNISNSELLANAGYSYMEPGVKSFLIPYESDEAFNEKLLLLKQSRLPVRACNSFLPGELKCVGPETHHEKILQFSETAFIRAKKAGILTIVFGSSASRNIPDGFSPEEAKKQFAGLCKQMAQLAKKYKVIISLEPLNRNECNFITTVKEGGEMVKLVNHPNFRLLADIYHMLIENENPESLIEQGEFLQHVHIAERDGRSAPGTHGEDFTPYFKALKIAGYNGMISVECNWDNLENQAKKALQTLQEQIESV
jgi:sugar phosphate isomerase/epimerase